MADILKFGIEFERLMHSKPEYVAFAKKNCFRKWHQGGCLMIVKALKRAFPQGKTWVVAEYDKDSDDWPLQHFVLKVGDLFVDSAGTFTADAVKGRFRSIYRGEIKLAPRRGFKNLWTGEAEMPYDLPIVRMIAEDAKAILINN